MSSSVRYMVTVSATLCTKWEWEYTKKHYEKGQQFLHPDIFFCGFLKISTILNCSMNNEEAYEVIYPYTRHEGLRGREGILTYLLTYVAESFLRS